ncbi:MAG TPA: hypothetical protein VL490_04020 [Mucilaginibacter sp.]|jgi:hypothetical protein|nr:hypothetical protein [Mucilaginibacter sp.]
MSSVREMPNPAKIRDITVIIAVYLYFSGWIYVYAYFGYYGLSMSQLDIDFYSLLIYSFNPFVNIFNIFSLPRIIILAVLISVIAYLLRKTKFMKVIKEHFLIPLLIIIFPALYYLSNAAGVSQAKYDWVNNKHPNISLMFKNDFYEDTVKKDTSLVNNIKISRQSKKRLLMPTQNTPFFSLQLTKRRCL